MTAKTWELQSGISYTNFPLAPPIYKPSMALSWGVNATPHGVVTTGTSIGDAMIGCGMADVRHYGTAHSLGIATTPLEGSGSGMPTPGVGGEFFNYVIDNTSIFEGIQRIDVYDCGSVDIFGAFPKNNYAAMFLSGKTLETYAGYFAPSSAGSLAVTGVGFQPDLVIFGSASVPVFGPPTPSTGTYSGFGYGAMDASGNQFAACCGEGQYPGGLPGRQSRFSSSHCGLTIRAALGSFAYTSMDTDGFTVNVDNATPNYFWFIALKDPAGTFKVGVATEGDTSLATGPSEAMIFASSGTTVLDTTVDGSSMCLGGGTSLDGTQLSGWAASSWGSGQMGMLWDTTAISLELASLFAPTATSAAATISSWGASTVGLNWTTGGAGGIRFGWISIKTSDAAGYDGCGGFIPQIYRWLKK